MKSQPTTIWESASRPLFVRSVWLEIARNERARRGGGQRQRHFILDYEPAQQQQQPQSLYHATALSPLKRCRSKQTMMNAALGHSLSCDFDCLRGSADDLLLIGSAKAQLHQLPTATSQQQQQQLSKASSSLQQKSGGRRASVLSKSSHGHGKQEVAQSNRRLPEQHEFISRRSSFQDLQSTLSNSYVHPDERLAERVLNWLDLAGKMDVVKTNDELKVEQTSAAQRRESFSRRATTATTSTTPNVMANASCSQPLPLAPPTSQRRHHTSRKRSTQSKFAAAAAATTYSCHHHQRRPDSMKHITIIFNKEGIPVRLNRPVRNIDLCSLASSAGTTRRLAGALASARLYKSAVDVGGGGGGGSSGGGSDRSAKDSSSNAAVTLSTARRQHTPRGATSDKHGEDTIGKSHALQKRLHDDYTSTVATNVGGLHDSKKQLHIFMPSLPKKGLLAASLIGSSYAGGGDDGASALSSSFNELCKL